MISTSSPPNAPVFLQSNPHRWVLVFRSVFLTIDHSPLTISLLRLAVSGFVGVLSAVLFLFGGCQWSGLSWRFCHREIGQWFVAHQMMALLDESLLNHYN